MKKFLILLLTFIIFCSSLLSVPSSASYNSLTDKLGLHADTYLLLSLDNSTVIFESNADKQRAPASLTKIVTAAVVLENCKNLEQVITVPEYCIEMLKGTGSSVDGLKAGEEMKIIDLLYCLLVESANDAALVLADYVGNGNIDSFIKMMNDLAAKLGCNNTSFVNPHGLDDDYQFTTARDIATLAVHALSYPVFKEIVSRLTYQVPESNMRKERTIYNTNKMLNPGISDYYSKYVNGVKTGSTSKAGQCVVSTASKDGYNYLCVVMGAEFLNIDDDSALENCAFIDAKAMLTWAIETLELVKISDSGRAVAEVPVEHSWSTDFVTLTPSEDSYELVPMGTDDGSVLIEPVADTVPKSIKAPVKKGDVICKANVMYAGEAIAQIDLVASSDADRSVILYVFSFFARIFENTIVKIIAVIIVAAAAFYAFVIVRARVRRRKNRNFKVVSYRDMTRK
ncbi:MAG: D-alanyl-D-alanine carboxypeptidase [Clostridia bacterium]|nr:D-alanyl-D-alanine carboxypeptidase [Clostridia bacterium]